MSVADYFAACICPRTWDRGDCTGRGYDPQCPLHGLDVPWRVREARRDALLGKEDNDG